MAKNKQPEVRIKTGWLLREKASVHLHELFDPKAHLATIAEINEIVDDYKKAWAPWENNIMQAMCDITGLQFRQNIIDVYVAPWFFAFSDPMVLGVTLNDEKLVRVLTHEILHRILTDNTAVPYEHNLIGAWQKLYGKNHSITTLVHIPLHAVHTAIAIDYLDDPSIVETDYKMNLDHGGPEDDYVKSWDYVNKHGYKEIIEKLKTVYK